MSNPTPSDAVESAGVAPETPAPPAPAPEAPRRAGRRQGQGYLVGYNPDAQSRRDLTTLPTHYIPAPPPPRHDVPLTQDQKLKNELDRLANDYPVLSALLKQALMGGGSR